MKKGSIVNTNRQLIATLIVFLVPAGCYDPGQFDEGLTGTGDRFEDLAIPSSTAGTPEGHENPGVLGDSTDGSTSSGFDSMSGGVTGTSNSISGESVAEDETGQNSKTGEDVGDESVTTGDADESEGEGEVSNQEDPDTSGSDGDSIGDSSDTSEDDSDDESSSESGSECTDAIKAEQAKCVNESEKHVLDLLSDCRDDLHASIEFIDTDGLDGDDLDAAIEKNSNLERIYSCRSERECYSMKAETQDEFYDCLQECATDFDWGRNGCAVDHDIAMTKCYENRTPCSGNTALDRAANKQCFDALNPVMQACVDGIGTQL